MKPIPEAVKPSMERARIAMMGADGTFLTDDAKSLITLTTYLRAFTAARNETRETLRAIRAAKGA